MRDLPSPTATSIVLRAAIAAGIMLLPGASLAQYIGGAPPPLPSPPLPGQILTPPETLARAVRVLARSPRDFSALITAGRAALDLGDTQAAIGFFGRAEEVRPTDPAPKIGMGAATVATGDADGALRWFFEAQRLGATGVTLGSDRGLAQDLLGNQASAQVDYRAALAGREAEEARRRLALSLGISGDRTGAFTALQPLLARRDPAAQRIRAFVLALVGDEQGASSAIDQAMPGTGARMAGFFRLLPTLSPSQKAAAVHLGVFPDPSEIRVAAVSPRLVTPSPPPRQEQRVEIAVRPGPTERAAVLPSPRPSDTVSEPRFTGNSFEARRSGQSPRVARSVAPSGRSRIPPAPNVTIRQVEPIRLTQAPAINAPAGLPVTAPAEPETAVAMVAEPSAVAPIAREQAAVSGGTTSSAGAEAESSPTLVAGPADRLSGIDRLLAQADELPVPPAPTPRFERPVKSAAVDPSKSKKAADLKKAVEAKKLAEATRAADLKKVKAEEEARARIGLAGTHWVQLAGGSNADRMDDEFRRLGAKSSALRKRGGAVTAGKDYFRLLTGPFASRSAAQEFVNTLAKDDVDGFSWTRTPATLKIEKLPPK